MPPKRKRAAAASKPPATKRGKAVAAGASRAAITADPVLSSITAPTTVVDQDRLRGDSLHYFRGIQKKYPTDP